ncbi:hypothetical protein QN277_028969 [Acacia crassicarpa]|uniref:AAA+ ATPase domain-containing protein n=1 Tax=Acacia crassicarpa TaxID=499986 RepID=A0AAE1MKD1_9FABA|nr:hypothetical protein QN277_028969 [Acacia crassicarpa]
MDEVGISVAAKVVEYLVDPTLRQLQYLFCISKITRNVETKKEELILKQGKVQERVEEAIKRTERIDDEVNKWKNEVVILIAEVENLVQELRANNDCFQRWRPTWRKYRLCKVLAKKAQHMTELNSKSDQLEPFSHHVIVPDIEYHSSKDFMFFKSTEIAHDELWEALQDDDNSMIGLWGMGGSGKTTLVKEVGKKAKESRLFDRVIITTVSQTPNIRKIQGEIADLLGLKLEEETEVGRARRIAMNLQSPEERILIILDDVWAMLNLEDIGNPFGAEGPRNNKVLLTSRRREICTLMECQKTIPLGLLTEDESWDLFQAHAKVDDCAREVAQEIAMECKGLPIAIVAMGKCLKGKGLDEANVVLYKLRRSKPVDVDKGGSDAFTCLKLSYDYLRIVEAKLLFLMCAMFPEDHEIIIEELFRYGVGLGLCEDADSFEIARSQIISAINVLIDSSLLMYSLSFWNEKCVKMHDMVRDVALWIASKEHGTILVDCAKELNELLRDETTKDCFAISSWNKRNESLQFPSQLDAPKLELLLLNSSKPLDLSNASFEGLKGLKVVALNQFFHSTKVALQSLQSIQQLSNLQTLRLQGWDLGDISFLVSLKRLEILDLKDSKFKKVPNGIEKLNRLKLLDLSRCIAEECFCREIGRCSQLEELYTSRNSQPSGYTICYECFVGVPALPKLKRYTFEIGECIMPMFSKKGSRELSFGEFNISISSAMIKDLAQRAIAIEFYKLQGGCKRCSPDVIQAIGGMNELTKLCLQHCSEIECFTDQTIPHEDKVVFRLVELVLKYMANLKQLCRGPPNLSLFLNLESLNIESCPQLVNMFPANCNLGNLKFLNIVNCPLLTSLFPVSVSRTLLLLEQLTIERCHGLKKIIEGEDGIDIWEDMIFPKWEILSVCYCDRLEFICPSFCVQGFVQLKSLFIRDAPQLKYVFGEHAGEETSICDRIETKIVLPALGELILEYLPNLLSICSGSYHLLWPSIMKVKWTNCPRLNTSCDSHIIDLELSQLRQNMESHVFDDHQLRSKLLPAVSNVESIVLLNCGVVSTFIPQIPIFQYLKQLSVANCAKLKFVFSACIFQSLPELTSITISCCEEMEQVFLENEETQKNLPIFCLPNLQSLEIKQCNKLKSIFSFMISDGVFMLPRLRTLSISDASQLEEIFRCSTIEHHDIDNEKEIMFPNLGLIVLEGLPRLANFCQGFKFQISMYCSVLIYECPKLVPNLGSSANWIIGKLKRKHVLKCSQLGNNEGYSPPLLILNSEELDDFSVEVQDSCRVIGDKDSEMFSLHQILKGLSPTQGLSFQLLHCLEVVRCEKLKFLFSASTIVHNSLPKLKFLTLSDCEELEEIIACNEELQSASNAQVCFPELQELEIQRCNKLRRLFSTTINTILPELNSLLITEASQLEVIFGQKREDGANNGEKIVLPKLSQIKLRNLPNFVNVCQGLQFEAVQLWSINIRKCPKLLNPILGSTQMVSLQQWKSMDSRGVQDFQSEASVEEQFHVSEEKGTIMVSKVMSLALSHSANLITTLWEGPTLISFQNLLALHVFECRKLKSIFPCTVIKSLPRLSGLSIKECEELEEIISEKWEKELDHFPNSSLFFPQLSRLEVYRCSKLKYLFSLPYIGDLAKLENVKIKGCSQLEQLFSCELEIREEESNKNLLPNLKYLVLEDLPKLTRICASVPLLVKFSSIWTLHVKHCPVLAKADNVEESEDYDLDVFYDDNDSIRFETTRQFLQSRSPQPSAAMIVAGLIPEDEYDPSQLTRYNRWQQRQ